MADKLCVCGHVMESRVTGKKIELHTADTGSLWSEFLAADLYICPWCGRMAFFEPEEARALRFRRACENKTIDQLRAIVDGEQPELLKRRRARNLKRRNRSRTGKSRSAGKKRSVAGSAKRCSPSFSARTRTTISRRRTARRSFDEFIVKCALCAHFPLDKRLAEFRARRRERN